MNSQSDNLAGIEFRAAHDHERLQYTQTLHRGFSGHFDIEEGALESDKEIYGSLASGVCAFDGDELVGTSCWVPFELTIPGGNTGFMGVTDVTVAATHRRRGIMREMMRQLLVKGRDSGQHIAGLWASESNIYGRYGFGISGETHVAKLDTRHGSFRKTNEVQGEVRFADLGKMCQVAPKIWEKAAAKTSGMIMRRSREWDWRYNPQRVKNIQKRKPFFVVYSENNDPLGYAEYSIEERHRDMHSANLVRVHELIPATTTAEVALWRYILDIDLASEIYHEQHPKKSNLHWLLADPRKLSLEPYDSVWIRIMEPTKALTARTYSAPGEIAIAVTDDFCPWTNGVYVLTVDDKGDAACERADRPSDITMPVASLGSIYMGAVMLSDLARAGRVTEHTPGAIAKIDTMFPTSGVHSFLPDF